MADPVAFSGTIHGAAHMAVQNLDAPIDPGTAVGSFDPDTGDVTVDIQLPRLMDRGRQWGLIPYTSRDIGIVPTASAKGHVDANGLTLTQPFRFIVPNLTLDWIPAINWSSGEACNTADDSVMTLTAPGVTDPRNGFTATGSFDMGRFTGCGLLSDPLFTWTMTSPGNKVTLTFDPA
ncbi:hypothetical protein [Nocardia sp. BMG51109]|uniref:hypothetical protein n=1 Tax=Nocardia sp. BMG51109 TaxID=1056816 RepID=UPI0012EB9192|nr:hypothetical protein [Nocardia sp. BMG51109]